MTVSPAPSTAAHIVADRRDTDDTRHSEHQRRAQTVIDEYSPEHQFVGSLLWLRAPRVRPLLALVPDTAIRRPLTRWAYTLIRGLVESGTDPTPVCVLAAAHHRAAPDALQPAQPPTATEHQRLALYLFDAYAQALAPATAIDTYAREVLDEAYRRAFDANGIRMQHLAASGADRATLAHQFTTIGLELADLRRRADAAAKTQP